MEDNLNNSRTLNQFHSPEELDQTFNEIPGSDESELDNFYIPVTEHIGWSEKFTNAVVKFGDSNMFIIIIAIILFIWILINAKLWTMI